MVAIIDSGDISELLDYRSAIRSKRKRFTSVAWRRSDWRTTKPHVALLLDDEGSIRWIGRAEGGQVVSDRDKRLNISEILDVDGISYAGLIADAGLPSSAVHTMGLLQEDSGRRIVAAFLRAHPGLAEEVRRLGRDRQPLIPRTDVARIRNEQRDATGLLLDISGIGRSSLREASETDAELPSFLAGLPDRTVSEQSLIDHDINALPGMSRAQSGHVDWRIFENSRRRLFVANTNMEPLELTLGVDVIYFNQADGSFVMVQYKRMRREKSKASSEMWYRPDTQLRLELDRMRSVDEMCQPAPTSDFRLHSQATWLKLCDPSATVQSPDDLIRGMYLPRAYFEALLEAETSRGPRDGVRLGYANVARHLTNTTFIELVKAGWIGTHGTSTERLDGIVRDVLTSRQSLVLGVQLSERRPHG